MNYETILSTLSLSLILTVLLLRIINSLINKKEINLTCGILLIPAALSLLALVALRSIKMKFVAITSLYESLLLFLLLIMGVYIITVFLIKFPAVFHLFSTVFIFLILGLISSPIIPKDIKPVIPVLKSYWLVFHIIFSFLGESFFTIAFILAVIELSVKNKDVKTTQAFHKLQYNLIAIGYPLFTLGALIFGSIWAKYAWGHYWTWDPKQNWSLITWLIFSVYFHLYRLPKWQGTRIAFFIIFGWLAMIFTFLGVGFLFKSIHGYL